ncbi:hypothetical protein BaRGS_00020783 [Batillaria attramentaria]|uniref:Uncharacterized protein n=1 Tax=Batillaria attramentaria TaxID=370345 RepID=A0ABD0KM00_9CAEN
MKHRYTGFARKTRSLLEYHGHKTSSNSSASALTVQTARAAHVDVLKINCSKFLHSGKSLRVGRSELLNKEFREVSDPLRPENNPKIGDAYTRCHTTRLPDPHCRQSVRVLGGGESREGGGVEGGGFVYCTSARAFAWPFLYTPSALRLGRLCVRVCVLFERFASCFP